MILSIKYIEQQILTRNNIHHSMRTQPTTRRIQNNVMKSPSPDIANRNIIKDTKTPIDDVKRYLQKSLNLRSPRLSDLTQSARFQNDGNQVEVLRMRVSELEGKVRQLTAQNQEYRKALEDKAAMQGEIVRMRETLRSYESSQVVTPRSENQSKPLEQMQERVLNLLKQNDRLGGLLKDKENNLKEKENNIQYLINQNRKFKNQIDGLKSQIQSYKSKQVAPIGPTQAFINSQTQNQEVNILKNYYEGRIEPQMRRSETEWLNRIRELSDRLNIIQQHQNYIQTQINKRSNVATPTKQDKSPFSNKKTAEEPSEYSSGIQLPQSVKPFESMTMRSTNRDSQYKTLDNRQYEYNRQAEQSIRELEAKCGRLQRQNQNQRKKIFDLEDQLIKKSKQISLSAVNYASNQEVEELIKRITGLEEQVDAKMLALSNAERDLRSTREDYTRLKQRSDRQIFLFENQKNTWKKSCEQQKQRSQQLEDAYNKFAERNQILEQKIKEKDLTAQQIRQQFKSQYEARQINIKKYYDDLYLNKERDISEQLYQYLQILRSIRQNIDEANIDQVIKESETAINQRITIEKQISYIRDENQRIIQELKARLIQQEQKIIELQKDNNMLRAQVEQLNIQKEKLKKAMLDFEVFKPAPANIPAGSTITTSYKFEQGCKLKHCLQETLKKIDTLEHQITEIIHK